MAATFDFKRRLGSGHFGEVWFAIETGLNVPRAVKLIRADKLPDPNNFFREAQILKSAEHRNIVRVEDTGTMDDGRVYVSMEHLQRGSIEDEAKGGFIPMTRAKTVMIDVLRGLEYAHGKGILHHDVKPGNILIGAANEAKLSDFGLALIPGKDPANLKAVDYHYTLHVAPEVFGGQNYSVLSDIYACGVTLYRLVNGDHLLPAIPPDEVATEAAAGRYPNRDAYRDFIPRQLRAVVNKAMSVDPAERYPSAREFRRAIETLAILVDWDESVATDRTIWATANGRMRVEIELYRHNGGRHDVNVRRALGPSGLRRVNQLCTSHLGAVSATKAARRVLHNFVTGKLN